jgi:transcription elongation factor Elf1
MADRYRIRLSCEPCGVTTQATVTEPEWHPVVMGIRYDAPLFRDQHNHVGATLKEYTFTCLACGLEPAFAWGDWS